MVKVTARVCKGCGKPKGCTAIRNPENMKTEYWHLKCWEKMRPGTKRARSINKAPPESRRPAPIASPGPLKSNTVQNQDPQCVKCGADYDPRRKALGYDTCLDCGSPKKQFTVAPGYNKGGLQLITNPNDLKTIHKDNEGDD